MKILLPYFFFLVLFITACEFEPKQKSSNSKSVVVSYVYDGDTFKGEDGKRYRLIGIDAPETAKGDSLASKPFADASKQFLNKLIKNKTVGIEYDVETYDKYGRELVYVWLNDSTMVNEHLLESGMASLLTIPPNIANSIIFIKAQQKAKKAKIGVWSSKNLRQVQ